MAPRVEATRLWSGDQPEVPASKPLYFDLVIEDIMKIVLLPRLKGESLEAFSEADPALSDRVFTYLQEDWQRFSMSLHSALKESVARRHLAAIDSADLYMRQCETVQEILHTRAFFNGYFAHQFAIDSASRGCMQQGTTRTHQEINQQLALLDDDACMDLALKRTLIGARIAEGEAVNIVGYMTSGCYQELVDVLFRLPNRHLPLSIFIRYVYRRHTAEYTLEMIQSLGLSLEETESLLEAAAQEVKEADDPADEYLFIDAMSNEEKKLPLLIGLGLRWIELENDEGWDKCYDLIESCLTSLQRDLNDDDDDFVELDTSSYEDPLVEVGYALAQQGQYEKALNFSKWMQGWRMDGTQVARVLYDSLSEPNPCSQEQLHFADIVFDWLITDQKLSEKEWKKSGTLHRKNSLEAYLIGRHIAFHLINREFRRPLELAFLYSISDHNIYWTIAKSAWQAGEKALAIEALNKMKAKSDRLWVKISGADLQLLEQDPEFNQVAHPYLSPWM